MAQELFKRAQEQTGTFQGFFGQRGNAFMGFPLSGMTDAPFFFQRERLRLVEAGARSAEDVVEAITFPIEGYDEMNVAEISERLDALSTEELERVRDYEKRNKDRDTLVEQIGRKIRTASA